MSIHSCRIWKYFCINSDILVLLVSEDYSKILGAKNKVIQSQLLSSNDHLQMEKKISKMKDLELEKYKREKETKSSGLTENNNYA